jgi:hypothetical protein
MALENFFRAREPWLYLAAALGVLSVLSFWFPNAATDAVFSEVIRATTVIGFFTYFLSFLSQYKHHVPPILDRRDGWQWDLFFVAELTIFLLIVVAGGITGPVAMWVTDYIRTPIRLGTSACYGPLVFRGLLRAVNARNIPVAIMVGVIVLMMMSQAPVIYTNISGVYEAADFLVNRIASGPIHACGVIIALVSAVTAIRTLIGRERGFLGR